MIRIRAIPPLAWQLPVLAAWGALTAVAISRHEPWFDEAQAFLLARDTTIRELLSDRLRYEGHPPLWYLLLEIPIALGAGLAGMYALTWLAGLVATWLLVRHAPFPALIRGILPFTYFLAYQYVVVARSYALLAPLVFALAITWPRRFELSWRWTGILVALSWVSAHGLVIAAAFVANDLLQGREPWRSFDGGRRRRLLAGLACFALSSLVLVAILWPTPDVLKPKPKASLYIGDWITVGATMLDGGLAESSFITLPAVVASFWWFRRRRMLRLAALSMGALLVLFAAVYFNAWHEGLVFLLWIALLWISFRSCVPDRGRERWIVLVPAAAVLVVQVGWTGTSIRRELEATYGGGPALAGYLRERGLVDAEIETTCFQAATVSLFLPGNVFDNVNDGRAAYWIWNRENQLSGEVERILARQPDFVVRCQRLESPHPILAFRGYELERAFQGALFWKNRVLELDSFYLLRRQPSAPGAAGPPP